MQLRRVSKKYLADSPLAQNYVLRGLAYAKLAGQPNIVVHDETNNADITTIKGQWSWKRMANGGFGSDTLWNNGTNWTIAGGVAHHATGAGGVFSQSAAYNLNGGLVIGRLYKLTYTILNYVSGTVTPTMGDTSSGSTRSGAGTFTEILRCAGTTVLSFTAGSTFVADLDNVSVVPVSEEWKPENLICSFELPTNARNGVASDCVAISIKLVNAATTGVVGWHQAELLANLLDNPSLETGAVADPWVPDAWANNTMTAGQVARETTVIHSGVASPCTLR